MKKLLLLLLCITSLVWSSCGSKDEPEDDTVTLVGKWQATKMYSGEYEMEISLAAQAIVFEFRADNTGVATSIEDGRLDTTNFAYAVQDGVVTITDSQTGEVQHMNIENLTDSELVISAETEGDDGRFYTDKMYLKRIN